MSGEVLLALRRGPDTQGGKKDPTGYGVSPESPVSLRDQLLKAGIVDKKKVQQAERDQKQARRLQQGHREKQAEREARAEAEQAARLEAERQQRQDERRAREQAREAAERLRQVDNLLRHHALPAPRGGTQRFWYRSPDGRQALRLTLPERLAVELRAGRLALAWHGSPASPTVILIPRDTALRVERLLPERLLFFNLQAPPPDDPSLALADPG